MTFSSIPFLFIFLPVTLIVYYLVPKKLKNIVFLIASLLFYAFGSVLYLLLLIASVVINYLLGRRLWNVLGSDSSGRPMVVLGIVINICMLFAFKYLGSFLGLFGVPLQTESGFFSLAAPIGISVYTLQAISYLMDIYRGDARVQKNIVKLGVYMTMFPRIFNGPIVQYNEIEVQLGRRKVDFKKFVSGSWIFLIGLAKQVVLAAGMSLIYENISEDIAEGTVDPGLAWVGAAACMMQIYFTMSGFSNMAMGMGRMFGFKFPANFNYPFTAVSIRDFWKRWTVTLVNWMNRYLRPALGERKVGAFHDILIIALIMALIGLWHGPSLNLLIWGLYFALILILEKYVWGKALGCLPKVIGHIYSLFLILIGFVIYSGSTLGDSWRYLSLMFGKEEYAGGLSDFLFSLSSNWLMLLLGVICATAVPIGLLAMGGRLRRGRLISRILEVAFLALILICMGKDTGLYTAFRTVAGSRVENGVVLGKGGQLMKELSDPDWEVMASDVDGINDFADENTDINTYILMIPDAAETLEKKLPAFYSRPDQEEIFDRVKADLSHNVKWLDGIAAMEDADPDKLYYETDSHWTTETAYSVFMTVAGEMGINNAGDTSYQFLCAALDFNGDLSAASGFCLSKKEQLDVCLPDELISYLVTFDGSDEKIPSIYDTSCLDNGYAYDLFFGGEHGLIDINTAAGSSRVILVVGDSFASSFVPFLIPHYGEIVFVDPDLCDDSASELVSTYGVTDVLYLYSGDTFCTDESLGAFLSK
ncbi:MAG: hypothetical protein LUC41_09400 [Clostridiales bacterium]|nr:hypothetical protein [Clostridiales bacterium]